MEASLYVHIPFCSGLCDYCDFYSVPVPAGDKGLEAYTDRLLLDAEETMGRFKTERIPTVYIGGGTPSVLGAAGIKRLLGGLEVFYGSAPEEITVEANPETADRAFLESCRDAGVSRVSLGVQSFHEVSRQAVGRAGDGCILPERLALVSEIFPRAFSADLISGLPFQDEAVLFTDIETLLSYEPAHISLYALTLEAGTLLYDHAGKPGRTGSTLPSPDEADRLWIRGRDRLEQAGYHQYEVSNFCLPGKESRHNLRYWRMENWLGLGPSASGTVIDEERGTALRCTVKGDVDNWLDRPQGEGATEELIATPALIRETLLMGFRYCRGPDPWLFKKRFRLDLEDAVPRTLASWRGKGLVRRDMAALNAEGLLFLNRFLIEAFTEIDAAGF